VRALYNVSGMGIYFLEFKLSDYLYRVIYGIQYVSTPKSKLIPVPLLSSILVVGYGLFAQVPSVYMLYVLPSVSWFILEKTEYELYMKAVGEKPSCRRLARC
jgi:ABC-type uncharacterized transport system permease subunit